MSNRTYDDSILLIGPSGVGKSTVAERLKKKTGMPRLCLDKIANDARRNGLRNRFRTSDEFNYSMIKYMVDRALKADEYGVVDFGAGHSVYDDETIFKNVQSLLGNFKNVVLLLYSDNLQESLDVIGRRSTGDTNDNRRFIESPCNRELASMVVYVKGKNPDQIADEILEIIEKNKNKNKSFEDDDDSTVK